ncbi:MAG: helix-turn-helix domain-containing protein [Clostridium sp.]
MIEGDSMDIGKAVKTQRMIKNLSVRELAAMTGLSPGAISKIENGKTIPNVITIKSIASAMGVSVSYFFIDNEEELIQHTKKDQSPVFIRNSTETGQVVESMLTTGKDLHMQPCILTFTPGSNSGEGITHKGEEFVYVLEGKIACILEGVDTYVLEKGDSLYYPCSIGHKWVNLLEDRDSRIMVVASPAHFNFVR